MSYFHDCRYTERSLKSFASSDEILAFYSAKLAPEEMLELNVFLPGAIGSWRENQSPEGAETDVCVRLNVSSILKAIRSAETMAATANDNGTEQDQDPVVRALEQVRYILHDVEGLLEETYRKLELGSVVADSRQSARTSIAMSGVERESCRNTLRATADPASGQGGALGRTNASTSDEISNGH